MKNIVKLILALALSCLMVGSISVNAATFTDELLWQKAAGTYVLENFDNLGPLGTPVNALPTLNITFNNTAYVYDGSSGGPAKSPPFSLINIYPYQTNLPPFSFSPTSSNHLITAVGLWNCSGDDELYLRLYNASGEMIESLIIGANHSTPVFGGIVNSEGATLVEIEGTGNSNYWIAIDNLQVALNSPLLVTLANFTATPFQNDIHIHWKTASEVDNAGFHLWRATGEGWKQGDYEQAIRITDPLIPSKGTKVGGYPYSYIDSNVESGITYYYGLEDIDFNGQSTVHRDFIDEVTAK